MILIGVITTLIITILITADKRVADRAFGNTVNIILGDGGLITFHNIFILIS